MLENQVKVGVQVFNFRGWIYSRFAILLLQIYELLFQSTETICEWACYFGTSLSAIIAWRLFRMEKLTLINKMFLCYFCIDVVFSSIETYFLFKLYKERYVKMRINFNFKKYNFVVTRPSAIQKVKLKIVSIFWELDGCGRASDISPKVLWSLSGKYFLKTHILSSRYLHLHYINAMLDLPMFGLLLDW